MKDSLQSEYVLDGEQFDTLEEFYAEVARVFVNGEPWGESLDALNVLLSGGIRQIPSIISALSGNMQSDRVNTWATLKQSGS